MLRVTLFSALLAAVSATRLESMRLRGGQQVSTDLRSPAPRQREPVLQLLP